MGRIKDLVKKEGRDILSSVRHQRTKRDIQHGNMSVRCHCINVARYSVLLSEKLKIPCDKRALIRGALLHDYFLYDWHDKEHRSPFRLHGIHHPKIALENAEKEFSLSSIEREVIRKHMWPLTLLPPTCREAWIVTAADKYCSLMETLHFHQKKRKRKK